MVSPQRIKAKLHRIHGKIMAYEQMLTTDTNPESRDILGRKESRLGQPINDLERAQAVIAQHDLYKDVLRNLAKVNLSYKDYCKDLRGKGIEDYPLVLDRIQKEADK